MKLMPRWSGACLLLYYYMLSVVQLPISVDMPDGGLMLQQINANHTDQLSVVHQLLLSPGVSLGG